MLFLHIYKKLSVFFAYRRIFLLNMLKDTRTCVRVPNKEYGSDPPKSAECEENNKRSTFNEMLRLVCSER